EGLPARPGADDGARLRQRGARQPAQHCDDAAQDVRGAQLCAARRARSRAALAGYVSRAGCFIEPSAAAYLIGMVGTELRRLSSEADKLVNYVGGKGRIGRAEIDELVRYSREHSNFELTDAIIAGNRKRALELLDHILANPPENPQTLAVMLVGAIASNYRKMLAAKELMR